LKDARYLLSFLPENNLDPPPFFPPSDPSGREDAELDTLVPDNPNKPYDIHDVIRPVVDDGDFLEVHELWAENLVCGFARLGGHPVGIVGNQPRSLAGVLDIDSSVKGARFVRFCDAFNIPIVTFVDVPGFLPDRKSTRLNSSHSQISYAVFCLKKKTNLLKPPSILQHTLTITHD